jgi:hypothetical protein
VQKYAAAMTAQKRILNAAASELAELIDNVKEKKIGPESASAIQPVIAIFRAYAKAAGTSHVHVAAEAALAEARYQRKTVSGETVAGSPSIPRSTS